MIGLYDAILLRSPTTTELDLRVSQLRHGLNLGALRNSLYASTDRQASRAVWDCAERHSSAIRQFAVQEP